MKAEGADAMAKHKAGALVDPVWLHRHRSDPKVRLIEIAGMGQDEMQAYRSGHLPGAACWDWKKMLWDPDRRDFPTPEDFARRCGEAGIANDTTVVFYGEGVQFGFYAWWTFRYCGHRKVRILDGARRRWVAEGRPLVTEEPPAAVPVRYDPVKRVQKMRIHRDKVLAALRPGGPALLDARSPEEYRGERVGGPGGPDVGAVRYGRIPGAQHLYFEDMLGPDTGFKAPEELARIVAARGVGPEREIIAYCRMSHRATVLYFALTELLGFKKVKIYDGSWTEWGNLVGVPVER